MRSSFYFTCNYIVTGSIALAGEQPDDTRKPKGGWKGDPKLRLAAKFGISIIGFIAISTAFYFASMSYMTPPQDTNTNTPSQPSPTPYNNPTTNDNNNPNTNDNTPNTSSRVDNYDYKKGLQRGEKAGIKDAKKGNDKDYRSHISSSDFDIAYRLGYDRGYQSVTDGINTTTNYNTTTNDNVIR